MRWRHPVFVCLISALALVPAASEEASVSVHGAWVRETPPGMTMMAGYMELRNNTLRTLILVGASSIEFEGVMIHRTIVREGIAGMVHPTQIELEPNASLIFAPGGYHLMLMKPKRILRVGDRAVINLEFRDGIALPVEFEVRK
jgi:periplasmic copper chaperone A